MSEDTAALVERVRETAAICAGEHPYEYAWGQFSAALDSLTAALERAERGEKWVIEKNVELQRWADTKMQALEARAQKAEAERGELEQFWADKHVALLRKLSKAEAVVEAARVWRSRLKRPGGSQEEAELVSALIDYDEPPTAYWPDERGDYQLHPSQVDEQEQA